ncbi:MAG: glycosidase [Armatimonadota bacterium]|nr:glycosidase [bacterium]
MSDGPFTRVLDRPLITPADVPVKANAVFNPGVVELDGEVLLLLRVEVRRGISEIRVARSKNGVDRWTFDERALLEPDMEEYPYEEWGCEDTRVTQVGPREWIIAYTAYSRYGPAVALARTSDFVTVERLGTVLSPTNKDAALFPETFDGHWLLLHRPVTGGQEHIWYASSPQDLTYWSQPGVLIPERGGPWWDGLRIGVGAPPIKTDRGWLLIYHGVKEAAGHPVYRLGLALLDPKNPRKMIARASDWCFGPEVGYEQYGLVPNVVFTCGTLTRGDEIWMYYGAADTSVGLATAKLEDLTDFVIINDYLCTVGRTKGTLF